MRNEETGRLDRGDGAELAWALLPGRGPTVVFLHGYGSDMSGEKAMRLREWCLGTGRALLRLEYSGHGGSDGAFEEGTIGRWAADARRVIEARTDGPLLLVGSSMGGWIALLTALALPGRVAGLLGLAAAPDFTEDLMWAAMPPAEQTRLMAEGLIRATGDYGEMVLTRALIEEGRTHLLLRGPIALACPVRLIHGQADASVPWETALKLAARLVGKDVQVTLVKDGDHRLSRLPDLDLMCRTLGGMLEATGPG